MIPRCAVCREAKHHQSLKSFLVKNMGTEHNLCDFARGLILFFADFGKDIECLLWFPGVCFLLLSVI